MRRTRIVATIGPRSESQEVLEGLVAAGVNVFRLSMAHGDIPSSIERLRRLRSIVGELAIMVDIPGPKIRAGSFGSTPVALEMNSSLTIEEGFGQTSTAQQIFIERENVLANLKVGDRIAVGDGGLLLRVTESGQSVVATVVAGGMVMGKPGLSLPASIIDGVLPTDDDRERLRALHDEDFDLLAVSFVRSAEDIISVRATLARPDVMVMAKIETFEGIENIDAIVEASDAIMVARGDMGVRLPIEEVPHMQKLIVRSGVRAARPVVVATQMLESMTHAPVPTRAEVTDVANAVLDGASAVMLSGETAIGDDPVGTVETMDRIVRRAEESFPYQQWGSALELHKNFHPGQQSTRITAAITGAAWRAAMEENAVAIVACTGSGMTARAISRFRPPMPIIALTQSEGTARQLHGSWGIDEIVVTKARDIDTLCAEAVSFVLREGIGRPGDNIVVMAGSSTNGTPVTDTVRMVVLG